MCCVSRKTVVDSDKNIAVEVIKSKWMTAALIISAVVAVTLLVLYATQVMSLPGGIAGGVFGGITLGIIILKVVVHCKQRQIIESNGENKQTLKSTFKTTHDGKGWEEENVQLKTEGDGSTSLTRVYHSHYQYVNPDPEKQVLLDRISF